MAKKKRKTLKTSVSNTTPSIWENLKAHFTFMCPQSCFNNKIICGDFTSTDGVLCLGEILDASNNKLVIRNDFFDNNFIKLGNGTDAKKFIFKNVTTSNDDNIITFLFKQNNLMESMSELVVSIGALKVYLENEATRSTVINQYIKITKTDFSGKEIDIIKSNKLLQNVRDEKLHRILVQTSTNTTEESTTTSISLWIDSEVIIENFIIPDYAIGMNEIYFGNTDVNPVMYISDIRLYNSNDQKLINKFKNIHEIDINSSYKLYCQVLVETSDVNSQMTKELQCPDNKLKVGWIEETIEENTDEDEIKIYKNKIVVNELGEY